MKKAGQMARLLSLAHTARMIGRSVDLQRGRTVSAIAILTSVSAFARSTRR
jgi:hypothetical protein